MSIVETEEQVGLLWGLRGSLLAYARRVRARVELGGGAGVLGDGESFHFPLVDQSDFEPQMLAGVIRFQGWVRIVAHQGAMDIRVSEPHLTVRDHVGVLSARARSDEAAQRLDLIEARLQVPTCDGSTLMWSDCDTVLSPGGVGLFEGRYDVGEEFAPLTARIRWRGSVADRAVLGTG
ncbi:HtaA domain-containing protein [Nocardioides sp.]|uniref:HtaA domain-containing protein n=1 Tax=Nocardioides sp. TaxID=35761 RepID=UPI0032191D1B